MPQNICATLWMPPTKRDTSSVLTKGFLWLVMPLIIKGLKAERGLTVHLLCTRPALARKQAA